MKLPDYIALQNTLIKELFTEELPEPLNELFKKLNDQHQHTTPFLYTQFYFRS